MTRVVPIFLLILSGLPGLMQAQVLTSGPGLPGLLQTPQRLQLPPGLVEILPINKDASFYGDAIRMVDCPKETDEPFGLCNNHLFGGLALMSSHLQGSIQIRFYPPVGTISHFEVSHPFNLQADDTVMTAPQLYRMPVQQGFIIDPLSYLSSGDVNLTTGEVKNLNYSVLVSNTFYSALQNANPKLVGNPFSFPGPYGFVEAIFQQRPDGLLDFTFHGSTFLPLGADVEGDPIRMPLPFCGPLAQCSSVEAQGTVLHPYIRISTAPVSDPPCGATCPDIPSNSDLNFTAFSYSTTLGDDFNLNVPQQGGPGPARTQLTGRVKLQFGERNGDYVPFVISALPPEALLAPLPLPPVVGFSFGMLGSAEFINFPKLQYFFYNAGTGDDPFNVAAGELNVKTGAAVGDFIFRSYFTQSIFIGLAGLNPGISPASEPFEGPLLLEKDINGETVLRFNGDIHISFTGFAFPAPDLKTGFITGPDSTLHLFYRIQAMHPIDPPTTVKTGSASNVVSSLGDTFSYNYSIPCNGSGGSPTFTYTNNNASKGNGTIASNTGFKPGSGTFTMQALGAVSCINSRTSRAAPGDYDTVQFTAFGTWSQDSNPHIATVQVSLSPEFPYVHIQVDGGSVSQANTKPAGVPLP